MYLSVLGGHFPTTNLSSAIFHICVASRGPSASAELSVMMNKDEIKILCGKNSLLHLSAATQP